ncbi:hypothetical protein MKX01_028980 [Papaver californicum]|nr:hypothetical protein MKX01_028980 [Papaver californicum]
MSSMAVATSSTCSHNLRRNIIYSDYYQQRHGTSSSSLSHIIVGGPTHLPRVMTMNTINTNFSSSAATNKQTSHMYEMIKRADTVIDIVDDTTELIEDVVEEVVKIKYLKVVDSRIQRVLFMKFRNKPLKL